MHNLAIYDKACHRFTYVTLSETCRGNVIKQSRNMLVQHNRMCYHELHLLVIYIARMQLKSSNLVYSASHVNLIIRSNFYSADISCTKHPSMAYQS